MGQKDIEKFAFLFLCGERDKNILLGQKKMTYADLDRLTYLTDFLGMEKYNLEIWNQYGGQFKEQFEILCRLYTEPCDIVSYDESEWDDNLHDKWLLDFCDNAPDEYTKKYIQDIIRQICNDNGIFLSPKPTECTA